MISPTVGRVVWYHHPHEEPPYAKLGEQPYAAHVAFVHSERLVNLLIIDHTGQSFARQNVVLVQEGDTVPASAPYAEWMPYQKGQAAKAEQADNTLAPRVEGVEKAIADVHKDLCERIAALTPPAPQQASQAPSPAPQQSDQAAPPPAPPSPAPADPAPQNAAPAPQAAQGAAVQQPSA